MAAKKKSNTGYSDFKKAVSAVEKATKELTLSIVKLKNSAMGHFFQSQSASPRRSRKGGR